MWLPMDKWLLFDVLVDSRGDATGLETADEVAQSGGRRLLDGAYICSINDDKRGTCGKFQRDTPLKV